MYAARSEGLPLLHQQKRPPVYRAAMSQVSGQEFEGVAGMMIGNNLPGLLLLIRVLFFA
jgi:hypothetical protein